MMATATNEDIVAAIPDYIRSLESYAERSGARLVRSALPDDVHGRMTRDVIVLRLDLDPEQELLTLVHELTHWLAHRDLAAHDAPDACIFEYEAEAVEAMVMARLGLPLERDDCSPTDDLLSASVRRVLWVSGRICDALGLCVEPRPEP
jgi:hypothetical protein